VSSSQRVVALYPALRSRAFARLDLEWIAGDLSKTIPSESFMRPILKSSGLMLHGHIRIASWERPGCDVILNGGKAAVRDRTSAKSFDVINGNTKLHRPRC